MFFVGKLGIPPETADPSTVRPFLGRDLHAVHRGPGRRLVIFFGTKKAYKIQRHVLLVHVVSFC